MLEKIKTKIVLSSKILKVGMIILGGLILGIIVRAQVTQPSGTIRYKNETKTFEIAPGDSLQVGGQSNAFGTSYSNVYETRLYVGPGNIHVLGNETLNQGGNARLRVGNAWNYAGIYADTSTTGTANDLVLGASSGLVRIGPDTGGQNLKVNGNLTVSGSGIINGTITASKFAGSSRFSIEPGNKTYGSFQVNGSGNGYSGIYFADDNRTLMVDSQYQGIYQEGVGWQWRWNNGTLDVGSVPWDKISNKPSVFDISMIPHICQWESCSGSSCRKCDSSTTRFVLSITDSSGIALNFTSPGSSASRRLCCLYAY